MRTEEHSRTVRFEIPNAKGWANGQLQSFGGHFCAPWMTFEISTISLRIR
jgi:hypothetical protein